ncbi:MAG TPA: glycoside hydrolase family 99-like domain-containing protein [Clostridia bacterium]|nr:glycoside hydrolase family 99-like domain-containing protein [Clostridia bacterium]
MPKREYLVGIDYFTGWWEETPNFWIRDGVDWRAIYPERVPILGCYNTQETMDAEIEAASKYADFFQILWYPSAEVFTDNFAKLNNGIKLFMASKNAHMMKFTMEYCNHEPYVELNDEIWDRQCRLWCEFMKHPSYLYVGGKAFFKVHGIHHFLKQHENDYVKASERMIHLREVAQKEGVGELILCAGAVGDAKIEGSVKEFLKQFDVHGTYGELPDLPQTPELYPYETLVQKARERWEKSVKEPFLPYMPFIMCGWDPRPWKDKRLNCALPTREQWRKALMLLKQAIDENTILRVPDGTPEGQKMFTIYAWNEFGEGGFMAPTVGDGYMKLEELVTVFGEK